MATTAKSGRRPKATRRFDAPIDRSWDHLEAIASTLANLRGAGSLAHELIQNADDAEGATRLTFRFTDAALVVEDDGGFQKCDNLRSDPCERELAGDRCCDFHAFAKLGGATKKHDPNTTGAFGIGFLSVYQVTDQPEILSAGIHWVIDEQRQHVLPCRSCSEPHIRKGTRIGLPWADTPTWLRKKLNADVVTAVERKRLAKAFVHEIPECMLFLRRIDRIDVFDGEKHLARFRRSTSDGKIEVRGPHGAQHWLVISASFEDAARPLRAQADQIGKRPATVSVAVRPGHPVNGRLYATLPTQVATELPLHLNATFFPRIDRKGILLEAGPEAAWNRAAIGAAAEALAENAEPLARELGPTGFWTLVNAASKLDSHHSRDAVALVPLWERMARALPLSEVMWTSASTWAVVERTVLAPRSEKAGRLLAALNVPTVGKQIRALVPWRRLGIRTVDLERLVAAVEYLGLDEGCAAAELPPFLQDEQQRDALGALLADLVVRTPPDDDLGERIRALPLWQGADGSFHSFEASYLVDKASASALAWLVETPLVVWRKRGLAKALGDLGDAYKLELAVDALTSADAGDFTVPRAVRILRWLQRHVSEWTPEQFERLRSVRFIPTSTGLRPARETVRAGGFKDHLAVTGVLDVDAAKGLDEILQRLRVEPLTFIDYLREHLPLALKPGTKVSVDGLVELIHECARRRDEIDADKATGERLAALSWVPCRDGYRRTPRQVYFESAEVLAVLGPAAPLVVATIPRRSGAADFLRSLDAANTPRPVDVVARVEGLVADTPTPQGRAAARAVLVHLSARDRQLSDESSPFSRLRDLAWLPAEGDSSRWNYPGDLFVTRWKRLFSSAGTFIALQRKQQETLATTLTALGVRTTPPVEKVVEHVQRLASAGEPPSGEILKWLDERADDDILPLTGIAFLFARDGSLNRPDGVFREPHPLKDRLPVLEARVAKYRRLLDALDVKRVPRGDDAVRVLLELVSPYEEGASPQADVLRQMRACWQVVAVDSQCDLRVLGGQAVVPSGDGSLWTVAQVVLDDQPRTARWLSLAARRRVIPDEGVGSAFARAGVEPLSVRLVAQVAGRSRAGRDGELEEELIERQPHVARVVVAEHGQPRRLLRFIERLRVRSLPQLRVRYSLSGIDAPEGSPVSCGAHFDATTGELFVQGTGLDVSWPDVALCLKDALLPEKGPSVTLPLEMVLSAETAAQAAELLSNHNFPELTEERWQELRETLATWHSGRDEQAADDSADEAAGAEESDVEDECDDAAEDASAESEHSAGDDESEDEDADASDETTTDSSGDPGYDGSSRDDSSGEGSSGRGQEGTGGRGQGRGREGRTGSGQRPGTGRRRGSSADRRLVSYVSSGDDDRDSRNEDGGDRSPEGEAGVDLVVNHLEEELAGQDLLVVKMPDKNKGYDVLVTDKRTGAAVRYIEVKSTEEHWGVRGVGMSRPQFELADKKREHFALYVVDHLYAQEARISWIHDPARRVTTFQYDEGWITAAEGSTWVSGARRPKAASTDTPG